jgi:hypothetical protein
MALVVSASVNTERAALTAVPLLLVPQMLLAGALVPYREMNQSLFGNTAHARDRGGIPLPAAIMPLRYAYEAMITDQATRNPFELERLRLQRRIDRNRSQLTPMTPEQSERFELSKEGLRRLLASGASSREEAANLVSRIRRTASTGSRTEVETMKIWPDNDPKARPASEFFVNDRIDLIVREAETFRNDYRDTERRFVFHALKKPIPFMHLKKGTTEQDYVERDDEMDTQRYCGFVLAAVIIGCGMLSTLIISRQNRETR